MTVILDTGILGLLTQHRGILQAEECRSWLDNLLANGAEVIVPEIADYELRRELLRLGQTTGLQRLDQLESVLEYLPVTTQAMRQAAAFWAEARKKGRPTSDAHALDGDCILAAQALTLGEPSVVIATTNVGHLSLFVQAQEWWEIR